MPNSKNTFKEKREDQDDFFDMPLFFDDIIEDVRLEDWFYLKELKQRKLFLNDTIDQFTTERIVKLILQYNKEDKDLKAKECKPILLYITSNGGQVDAGFKLIDVIQNSKTPVYTINLGYQYSMGFLVGLAGHKRYSTKNATFLLHDGSSFAYNSAGKMLDQMKFQNRIEQRVKEYILSKTKITSKEYDNNYRVEWYMFADEAKAKGVTDFIIGEDCTIDSII